MSSGMLANLLWCEKSCRRTSPVGTLSSFHKLRSMLPIPKKAGLHLSCQGLWERKGKMTAKIRCSWWIYFFQKSSKGSSINKSDTLNSCFFHSAVIRQGIKKTCIDHSRLSLSLLNCSTAIIPPAKQGGVQM